VHGKNPNARVWWSILFVMRVAASGVEEFMSVGGWSFFGAVALPAALTFLVFLFANIIAPDSEAGLLWAVLPGLLFLAAIIGTLLGALIGALKGKGR
jgi:hypothetical protein